MSGRDLEGDAGFVDGLLFVGGEQVVVVGDDSAVEDERSCIAGDGSQRKCRRRVGVAELVGTVGAEDDEVGELTSGYSTEPARL